MMTLMSLLFIVTLALSQTTPSDNGAVPASNIHPAIIVGAGIAGIASSKELTSRNIPHIILEARNRIGGRIVSDTLQGIQVDLGATFVHNPLVDNQVDSIIKKLGWPTIPAKFYLIEEYFKSGKELTIDQNIKVQKLYKQFQIYLQGYILMHNQKTDLLTGWLSFYKAKSNLYTERVLEKVYFELLMEALTSGADVREMSAKEYINNRQKGNSDYIPKGGYFALLKAIFDRYCGKATVKYETVVTEIDYSSAVVKVTTSKGDIFYAKKVISSLPLGVLKAGDVKFIPSLPTAYQDAIENIGNGVFNKIIVSLSDWFWTKGVKVLDFVPLYSEPDSKKKYLEGYVVSDENPSVFMFFTGGSTAKEVSNQADSVIINQLMTHIKSYINPKYSHFTPKHYKITRWQLDPFSKGSYSYYGVNTKKSHFETLSEPINNRLYFIGEHTDHKQSSNAHGGYKTGSIEGIRVAAALTSNHLQILYSLLLIILILTY